MRRCAFINVRAPNVVPCLHQLTHFRITRLHPFLITSSNTIISLIQIQIHHFHTFTECRTNHSQHASPSARPTVFHLVSTPITKTLSCSTLPPIHQSLLPISPSCPLQHLLRHHKSTLSHPILTSPYYHHHHHLHPHRATRSFSPSSSMPFRYSRYALPTLSVSRHRPLQCKLKHRSPLPSQPQ